MSAYRLHGLTDTATATAIEYEVARLKPAGLQCVRQNGLAAIVSPAPRVIAFLTSRKALALDMVAFQQVLESLMRFGPIVPASYQARFASEAGMVPFLIAHHAPLSAALREFGDKRQFQITIAWDPEAMLRRLKDSGVIASGTEALQREGLSPGQALQQIMQSHKAALSQTFEDLLRSVSIDCLILPGADANSLLNATLLIEADGEARLDAAVAAIDATASEALKIKMAGPLPACGFASIGIDVPASADLKRACKTLGVDRMASPADLKAAYYERMRQRHPDIADAGVLPDTEAKTAYGLLLRVRTAELALDQSDAARNSEVPLLQMMRADLSGLAA